MISDFHQLHKGETCVIVGLGPNLKLTPPTMFDYPSFGINTIYKQTEWNWKPTYYVGVDERLRIEDGNAICESYPDVPKFFPSPDWDEQQGENIHRFLHRPGSQLFIGGQSPQSRDALTKYGITYKRIMEAVLQIAWYMGFETMLMIGIQHKPGTRKELVWGYDANEPENDFTYEEIGYAECVRMMNNVKILNISEDTYVPEMVLPRDDFRNWSKVYA